MHRDSRCARLGWMSFCVWSVIWDACAGGRRARLRALCMVKRAKRTEETAARADMTLQAFPPCYNPLLCSSPTILLSFPVQTRLCTSAPLPLCSPASAIPHLPIRARITSPPLATTTDPSHTSCTGSSHTTSPPRLSHSSRSSTRAETTPRRSLRRNDPPDRRSVLLSFLTGIWTWEPCSLEPRTR